MAIDAHACSEKHGELTHGVKPMTRFLALGVFGVLSIAACSDGEAPPAENGSAGTGGSAGVAGASAGSGGSSGSSSGAG